MVIWMSRKLNESAIFTEHPHQNSSFIPTWYFRLWQSSELEGDAMYLCNITGWCRLPADHGCSWSQSHGLRQLWLFPWLHDARDDRQGHRRPSHAVVPHSCWRQGNICQNVGLPQFLQLLPMCIGWLSGVVVRLGTSEPELTCSITTRTAVEL